MSDFDISEFDSMLDAYRRMSKQELLLHWAHEKEMLEARMCMTAAVLGELERRGKDVSQLRELARKAFAILKSAIHGQDLPAMREQLASYAEAWEEMQRAIPE
jgi:hypothetical protein